MRQRKNKCTDLGVILLDVKQVSQLCNIGKSTIWVLVKEGKFPKPVKLTTRCTRWKKSDVVAWGENLLNENDPAA